MRPATGPIRRWKRSPSVRATSAGGPAGSRSVVSVGKVTGSARRVLVMVVPSRWVPRCRVGPVGRPWSGGGRHGPRAAPGGDGRPDGEDDERRPGDEVGQRGAGEAGVGDADPVGEEGQARQDGEDRGPP